MPVIARSQSLPLASELAERLSKLEPALLLTPPSSDATLYIGWFNDKPISAAWACGIAEGRQLSHFAIHPATRGRGVLARLAQLAAKQQQAAAKT